MADMNDIEQRHKELLARRDKLNESKVRVDAELASRRRSLKEAMEECKRMGFNPETLDADIKHMREVLNVKMDVFQTDLQAAEDQIRPMLKEIG